MEVTDWTLVLDEAGNTFNNLSDETQLLFVSAGVLVPSGEVDGLALTIAPCLAGDKGRNRVVKKDLNRMLELLSDHGGRPVFSVAEKRQAAAVFLAALMLDESDERLRQVMNELQGVSNPTLVDDVLRARFRPEALGTAVDKLCADGRLTGELVASLRRWQQCGRRALTWRGIPHEEELAGGTINEWLFRDSLQLAAIYLGHKSTHPVRCSVVHDELSDPLESALTRVFELVRAGAARDRSVDFVGVRFEPDHDQPLLGFADLIASSLFKIFNRQMRRGAAPAPNGQSIIRGLMDLAGARRGGDNGITGRVAVRQEVRSALMEWTPLPK